MKTTTTEQIACIAREIKLRQNVFPKRVQAGHMTAEKAAHEIACMEDILDRLKRTDEGEAEDSFFPTLL